MNFHYFVCKTTMLLDLKLEGNYEGLKVTFHLIQTYAITHRPKQLKGTDTAKS